MKRFLLASFMTIIALVGLVGWWDVDSPQRVHAQQLGRRFNCVVQVSTATILTAVGGDCVAPTGGLALHITQVSFSTNAAGIAADSFPTLKFGTGGTCGTGTTIWWGQFTPAATQATAGQLFQSVVDIPAGNEICWIDSTAGSKFLVIGGQIY